jgi:hypothetical protein
MYPRVEHAFKKILSWSEYAGTPLKENFQKIVEFFLKLIFFQNLIRTYQSSIDKNLGSIEKCYKQQLVFLKKY